MPIYTLEKKEYIDKVLLKLAKRNQKELKIICKKLEQILQDPYRFKPLRSDMKECREVHIDKHFALVYSVDEQRKVVTLHDFDHHENIFI